MSIFLRGSEALGVTLRGPTTSGSYRVLRLYYGNTMFARFRRFWGGFARADNTQVLYSTTCVLQEDDICVIFARFRSARNLFRRFWGDFARADNTGVLRVLCFFFVVRIYISRGVHQSHDTLTPCKPHSPCHP